VEAQGYFEKLPARDEIPFLYLKATLQSAQEKTADALETLSRLIPLAREREEFYTTPADYDSKERTVERLYQTFHLHPARIERDPAFEQVREHPEYPRRVRQW
jgi:hypothetical protein